MLLEELGPDAETIFSQFERTPTAAASLAQVRDTITTIIMFATTLTCNDC